MKNLTNQHGDVLFFRIDSIPKTAKSVAQKSDRKVIKEGEHTGHAHVTYDDVQILVDAQGRMFIEADEPFVIEHEEHDKQVIEKGLYEIDIVREYDYDAEAIRRVQD